MLLDARNRLEQAGLKPRVIIDCSHANSGKDHRRQAIVWRNVLEQRAAGDHSIVGVMLESNINPGKQPPNQDRSALAYGVSITDACIGWDETETLLREAYDCLGT
jgi:3-deoxy-7-phosphoheptulonate synthase